MDINYLLLLQNFREATGNVFTPLFYAISEFVISFWPLAFFALVYWAYDKKTGFWFLLNMAGAYFLNGILKLTACIYRPWIRDSRIVPAGNSLFSATGYSFPSGHSTLAGAFYGSIGVNQWKKRRWISIIAFFFAALTLFSRNYLGVHTPQDVLVGFFSTLLLVFLNIYIAKKMFDEGVAANGDGKSNKMRDIYIFIAGILICAAAVIYINVKSYPLDYKDGVLIVDPEKMKPDTYAGIGFLFGFVIGWFIEKKCIRFEIKQQSKKQLTVAITALAVLYFFYSFNFFLTFLPRSLWKFLVAFLYMIYIQVLVPLVIKKVVKE